MTDSDLRTVLAGRLDAVAHRIAAACARARRQRDEVTLVAVTKSVPAAVAAVVAELGFAHLGEGRPQELWRKAAAVPGALWHLVGHLQRNKLDRTLPHLTLFHAADSDRLLAAIDAYGRARGTPVPVLLEVNASREPAKGGFAPEAVVPMAEALMQLAGVRINGLMTMARQDADPAAARPTFAELRGLRDQLRAATGLPLPHLSMGMSHDYEVGIEEGATFVRVGTALFHGLGDQ